MNTLVNPAGPGMPAAPAQLNSQHAQQYLTFMLGGEMFSINILRIKEIIWYTNMTEVPMMPACIRGVINLRGAVVPVMDLSERFGKPSTPVTKSSCIVIVEMQATEEGDVQNMGVVVDAVQAVMEIAPGDIEPAPSFGAKIRSDFIEGIAKVEGRFVVLLSIHHVLSPQEIATLGQATLPPDSPRVLDTA